MIRSVAVIEAVTMHPEMLNKISQTNSATCAPWRTYNELSKKDGKRPDPP